jgi:hypothetical protein
LRTNKFGTIRSVHLIKFTFDIRPIERNCWDSRALNQGKFGV